MNSTDFEVVEELWSAKHKELEQLTSDFASVRAGQRQVLDKLDALLRRAEVEREVLGRTLDILRRQP